MEQRPAFASPVLFAPRVGFAEPGGVSFKRAASVSAQMKLPEIPKMPKLPDLPSIPGFGQGKTEAEAIEEERKAPAKKSAVPRAPTAISPTVRAAEGAVPVPTEAKDAKTLGELTGVSEAVSLASGAGWKRFPKKRMPGANLDGWKAVAKEISPDM